MSPWRGASRISRRRWRLARRGRRRCRSGRACCAGRRPLTSAVFIGEIFAAAPARVRARRLPDAVGRDLRERWMSSLGPLTIAESRGLAPAHAAVCPFSDRSECYPLSILSLLASSSGQSPRRLAAQRRDPSPPRRLGLIAHLACGRLLHERACCRRSALQIYAGRWLFER